MRAPLHTKIMSSELLRKQLIKMKPWSVIGQKLRANGLIVFEETELSPFQIYYEKLGICNVLFYLRTWSYCITCSYWVPIDN